MSNWKKVKLEDICINITDGVHNTVKDTINEQYYLLSCKNIKNGNVCIDKHDRTIGKETLDRLRKRTQLSKGDVLLSSVGTIGETAIVKEEYPPYEFQRSVAIFKPDKRYITSKFLFYSLNNKKKVLQSMAEGAVQQCLFINPLKQFQISIPPLDEQRKIAGILSALDDKIELNNKINRNLEAQAQAIFKSWFIDFEPFKNGKFIDSELGKIPEGWSIGTIGDISIISTGKRPDKRSTYKSNETPIPIIGASSIMGYTNKVLYDEKMLVTGRVGTHGIIQKIDFPCWPSDNTLVLKSKNLNFLHNCLLLINWKSMNRGSTQPLITQNDLKNTRIILPQDRIIQNYEQLVHCFDIKFYNNNKEIYVLSQLRDILLPKLLSGEIDVTKITV